MWSQFNNLVTDDLKSEIANVASNNVEYKEVPEGAYEVFIEDMKATITKATQKPMLAIRFRILEGSHKNQIIFMNQVLMNGTGIHFANEFMRSLGTGVEVKFETFSQYEQLIEDVFAASKNYEYALDYGKNSKGFNTYKIVDIWNTKN